MSFLITKYSFFIAFSIENCSTVRISHAFLAFKVFFSIDGRNLYISIFQRNCRLKWHCSCKTASIKKKKSLAICGKLMK